MSKMNDKVMTLLDLFKNFSVNDWCYESKRTVELVDMMEPEDKIEFNFNPKTIDWNLAS